MSSQFQAQHLTLDLLVLVLTRTLFHPFLAALLPLCLRALGTPYSAPSFIYTSTFAILVSLYYLLAIANKRYAYGKPRHVKWEDEVVVITGGKGGLGGCLAEILGMRGVGVAVLDVVGGKEKGEEGSGVRYWKCDVGNYEEVERVWEEMVKELGTPTILINNAAVVNAGSFLSQTQKEVEDTFRINTLSHYHLSRLFIRGLLSQKRKAGTIITVSSVLAHLGASHLSAYTASKAALLAYHTSLTAELALLAPHIKTILLAPGQLDTQLFGKVKLRGWLRNFLGPVVGAGEVAVRIVEMLDKGEGGVVSEPAYARWIAWVGVLPVSLQMLVRRWSGVDEQFGDREQHATPDSKEDSDSSDESDSDQS